VKLREPQFEGQTKTKLGNGFVNGMVQVATNQRLAEFFEENPNEARAIVRKITEAARARLAARKARESARKTAFSARRCRASWRTARTRTRSAVSSTWSRATRRAARRSTAGTRVPGHPAAARQDPERREGARRQGLRQHGGAGHGDGHRHRHGRRVRPDEGPLPQARRHDDADVDGAHIRTLILTFLFRHMQGLIDAGYVYIAQPPLYRVKIGREQRYLVKESSWRTC
jgi:DNA gyrase subunit B